MPIYHQQGEIPSKIHIVHRQPNGKLYQEELVGTQGFAGMSSLVYHLHPPTQVTQKDNPYSVAPKIAIENGLDCMSFNGFEIPPEKDYIKSRKTLFVNSNMHIGLAAPTDSTPYFYKNADADELLFIHEGTGILKTMYGELQFKYGDYIVIPRGTVYQINFDSKENRLLYVESFSPIYTSSRYRNQFGQLLEHSPFCERDIIRPSNLKNYR
jgi:homogentisate 1,2-dioxygenase